MVALSATQSTIVSDVAQQRADEELLAGMFDALIRACRTDTSSSVALAQRLITHWGEHANMSLAIEPQQILIGKRVVMSASLEQGRWLLPAFMAGVRRITLTGVATLDDVLRLARELGALKLDEGSLGAFRNWLWADGAEGWEVECHMSFVELLEFDTSSGGGHDAMLESLRISSMLSMDAQVVSINARDLDAAALQPEFSLSIDALNAGSRSRAFELTMREQNELRDASSVLDDWADAELDMILSHTLMQNALPVQRVAQRLLSAMQASSSVSLMERVCAIYADTTDAFSVKLVKELGRQDVLQVFARLNVSHAGLRQRLVIWLMGLDEQDVNAWWAMHLGCATPDTVKLIRDYSSELLLAQLDVSQLDAVQGLALVEALQALDDVEREVWFETLADCKAEVIAYAMDRLSDRDLVDATRLLERMSRRMDEPEVQRSMERVLDRGLSGLTGQVASMILPCWPSHMVRRVFSDLNEQGVLEEIVRHMRQRKNSINLRTIALKEVEKFPPAYRRGALKWRAAELFDSPDFGEKLKTARRDMRRELKESKP
jgi:hypothetical protein